MMAKSTIRTFASPRTTCRGFTLVELVVSMVIMSSIMLAVGSVMLVAARAVPEANSPAQASVSAAGAVEQMVTELQYAVSVIQRSATMIEFTVGDRNGDDVPETIRYEWSGTPGDPLTRQFNGGTVVNTPDAVYSLSLSYDLETRSEEVTLDNESAETLLAGYDSTQSLADYPIDNSASYGQYFQPSLPADAVSWKVTKVVFWAKANGATKGEFRVQICLAADSHLPDGTILEERNLLESTLTSAYLAQEIVCSNASGLVPGQGLNLLVTWISDKDACDLHGQGAGVTTPDSHLIVTTDQAVSWSALTDQSLLYSVYGTVTTTSTQVQDVPYLRLVKISLQKTRDEQSGVSSIARILNVPEVAP